MPPTINAIQRDQWSRLYIVEFPSATDGRGFMDRGDMEYTVIAYFRSRSLRVAAKQTLSTAHCPLIPNP